MKSIADRAAERVLGILVALAESGVRRASRDGTRVFFEPVLFPWTAILEGGWRDIVQELDRVLAARERIPSFQDVSEEQRSITDDDRWKVFVFYVFGTAIEKNCRSCPKTARLLRAIPGLRNAMFSILSPRKRIPEHRGIYNGLLRYHLALKVPGPEASCAITVNGVSRSWREGRTLIFDDTFPHAVRNDTDGERIVLFADFERPLPWPLVPLNRAVLALIARTPLATRPIERFDRGEI